MRWLGSVKTLDVCVETYINTADPHMPKKPRFEQFFEVLRSPDGSPTSWMTQLATLCRKRQCVARVLVADDPFSAWGAQGMVQYRRDYRFNDSEYSFRRAIGCLTIAEKRDVARKIEELLKADEEKWKAALGDAVGGRQHPDSD